MRLLEIQSSPRGESSDSIALTRSFIEACKSADAEAELQIQLHQTDGRLFRAIEDESLV